MGSSDGSLANNPNRKRIITPARKEQNRVAQQLYRQRQRDRFRSRESHPQRPRKQHHLRPREPRSTSSEGREISLCDPVIFPAQEAQNDNVVVYSNTDSCTLDPVCFTSGNGLSYDELLAVPIAGPCYSLMNWNPVMDGLVVDGSLPSGSDIVDETSSASQLPNPTTFGLPWSNPDWHVEEDVLGGQIASNYIQTSSGMLMESTDAQNEPPSFTQTQAFQDVVLATIKFIRQHSIPTNFRLNSLLLPDPYKNLLHCPQTTTLMACFQNALCIGMEIQDLLTHRSPFYRPNTTISDDAQTLLTVAQKPWMPLNLQPTLPQILIPHHPYLDLIPFPGLRSRAITLAATMPQLFDPMEFKMDLFRDGMFWLRQGDGNRPPWEAKSWQIAPWFVTKWKLLLD